MREGEWDGVPGKDQLAETMVPSSAKERRHHSAVLQVPIATATQFYRREGGFYYSYNVHPLVGTVSDQYPL